MGQNCGYEAKKSIFDVGITMSLRRLNLAAHCA